MLLKKRFDADGRPDGQSNPRLSNGSFEQFQNSVNAAPVTERGQREKAFNSEEVNRFDHKSEKPMPRYKQDLLLQELIEVKESKRVLEVNHKEAVETLNERIQQQ